MFQKIRKHIEFRWNLGQRFSNLRKDLDNANLDQLKLKFLSNAHSDYMLISSMGGVASTSFIETADRLTPYNVNPVSYCSIHKLLINQKLKHLIRPLDTESYSTFPELFQGDLKQSNIDISKIKKAIFIIGDPASTVLSLYRRGLEKDHAQNILQTKEVIVPHSVHAFIEGGLDHFHFRNQIEQWLKGSSQYDTLILKYDEMWDYGDKIAEFLEVDANQFKKHFIRKPRQTKQNELYQRLRNEIYLDLCRDIDQIKPFKLVEKNDRQVRNS